MTDILPFGSDESEATIPLGPQTFLGLSVVDINCTSSWDQQGGQCSLKLLQDTGQYLEEAVVGSPQYFEIATTGNQPVFRFYGLLKELSRSVSPSSKEYTAVIQSPTLLLEACSIITEGFTGYGGAIEGYGPNVPTCLDFGHRNSSIDPNKIFNIQNVFGVYENDIFGFDGAGFGKANITEDGMRIDLFTNALHELVNGNPTLTPKLGSNIIYGSDSYSGGNAYAYNFDVNGFLAQIIDYIPSSYRVKSTNLLDFVNELCSLANFIYYVDLRKPVGSGLVCFNTGHETTLTPLQTHTGTVYGGQIVVITQNRNVVSGTRFPLSKTVIAREVSDKNGGSGPDGTLPLDMGLTGTNHPEGQPIATSPYGGSFPVESIDEDNSVRYTSTNLSVRLNESAVAARYVVGGFQSRINYVATAGINRNKSPDIIGSTCNLSAGPDNDLTADVYAYYGHIDMTSRLGYQAPNVPVLVPLMGVLNNVPIDIYDIVGNLTIKGVGTELGRRINGPVINGVYLANQGEFALALKSFESWIEGLNAPAYSNPMYAFTQHFQTIFSTDLSTYDSNGNLTSLGRAFINNAVSVINLYNTASDTTQRINTPSLLGAAFAAKAFFLRRLYERVKYIAENHYGKTYAVKCPAFSTSLDADGVSPLNSFIRSWDISPDAYLEPSKYKDYEAPETDAFVSNGRLKSYVVYHNPTDPGDYIIYYGDQNIPVIMSSSIEDGPTGIADIDTLRNAWIPVNPDHPLRPGHASYLEIVQRNIWAFTPMGSLGKRALISPSNIFKTRNPYGVNIVCLPAEVSEEYLFLPPIYFSYISINGLLKPLGKYTHDTEDRHYLCDRAYTLVNFLTTLNIPYDGNGCVSFALVTTEGIFDDFPKEEFVSILDEKPYKHLDAKDPTDQGSLKAKIPKAFGIAQQSNRYVYGPWITDTNLFYGGKIEYVKDENLVPENYILPSRIDIGGVSINVETGYDGMNTVGQLIANTVENFDYFYTEEGNVSIPGLPVITNLGQALVAEGPLVSDISLNLTANSLSTQYSMKTFAPKFGRANKFVIDQLTRIARNVSRKS